MARIFNDTLQPNDCSGLYTLMGLANGQWHDIHTISGVMSGNIEIDAMLNAIVVDTSVFIPGQSYLFKWVDSDGVESNVNVIYIPAVLLIESGVNFRTETGGIFLVEN